MPHISFSLPIRLIASANASENRWVKQKRTKEQRSLVAFAVASQLDEDFPAPYLVTITRLGKRLMDCDNVTNACKCIRDGVADALGVNDGDKKAITFMCFQEKAKEYGCRIEIEPRTKERMRAVLEKLLEEV